MKEIYTITAIQASNESGESSRLWGWYEQYYDAVEATIENVTDMNEAGYYPFIVIEKVTEGVLPLPNKEKETWFEFDHEDKKYHKIDKPEEFKQIVNWGMG